MNLFRSSISSLAPSSAASSDPTSARASLSLTPPSTGTFPSARCFSHRPSTTTTNTTTTTGSSSPALNGGGSNSTSTTESTASRIVSSFNPTKTYHIPTHGGVMPSTTPLQIYDLTPHLKNRVPAADPYSDRKAFKREVRSILKAWKEREKEGGKGKDVNVMGGLETAMVVRRGKKGVKVLEDLDSSGTASWSVPWALWKEIVVDIDYPGRGEWDVGVWTHTFDPRSQIFESRGASYRWKFATPRELVLEKSAPGMGRYVVAVFYLTRGVGTTEGTLLFDERGVDRLLAVATILTALKRERQRWGVLGGTV
ncbi:hypothetical protein BZA05DRAFT_199048 [Tricharina praecox]|uniref:uncharacterized protein n=1 Tax=Tricharina praecox TaxID=43433 RepID=UPI002220BFC3|nr:uncharacterized protein BZA05DRAFT_199048 [Tricharina praecox]KAI5856367.1 hypothetical protein BZA05DRAFT_199048 [Tricharina praecox]